MAATEKRIRLTGAERRQIILDAATKLFAARGFQNTSVIDIADASGISKIVLYDHFRSKEDLFIEITRLARDGLIERGRRSMQSGGKLEMRLHAAFDTFFSYAEEEPDQARILLIVPSGDPELRALVSGIQDEATRNIADLLAADTELATGGAGGVVRLTIMSEFIKAGLHGLVGWWADHPGTSRDDIVSAAMDVAWRGLKSYRQR